MIGLFSVLSLPMSVCLEPLAGLLSDVPGSYEPVTVAIRAGVMAVPLIVVLLVDHMARPALADAA